MGSAIESLVNREYPYGFVTDVETDTIPSRSERGRRPADLGKEERARSSCSSGGSRPIAAGSR